jgi:hypothetical protein
MIKGSRRLACASWALILATLILVVGTLVQANMAWQGTPVRSH